jgi:hypothetical protein
MPSSVQVGLPFEIPTESLKDKQLPDLVEVQLVHFEELILQGFISERLKDDIVISFEIFPVVYVGLWVNKEHVALITIL